MMASRMSEEIERRPCSLASFLRAVTRPRSRVIVRDLLGMTGSPGGGDIGQLLPIKDHSQNLVPKSPATTRSNQLEFSVSGGVHLYDNLFFLFHWVWAHLKSGVGTPSKGIFRFFQFLSGLGVVTPQMPNQRRADKKKIGVWLTDEEERRVKAKLKAMGFDNLADYLRSLSDEAQEDKPTMEKGE